MKVSHSGRKQKGRRLEKIAADELSIILYDAEDYLRPNPQSGAQLWKGDVVINSEGHGEFFNNTLPAINKDVGGIFPLIIECKNTEEFELDSIYNEKSFIKSVLDKVSEEAKESKSLPIMVGKKNNDKPFILFPVEFLLKYNLKFPLNNYCTTFKDSNHHWIICKLSYFCANLPNGIFLVK